MKPPARAESCTKRPYLPPKLFIYGDLTEMTRTAGFRGMADGGHKQAMKRSAVR